VRLQADSEYCATFCGDNQYLTCLSNVTLTTCEAEDLGCGVISEPGFDGYCWLWQSPIHGDLEFGDPSPFAPGDTVHVLGTVSYGIPSSCWGDGLLLRRTVSACGDTLTSVEAASWGRLKTLFRE
jgi:hypothetical protein